MAAEFEYVVVGLGGIGSATVHRLASRAGESVLGIEQFEFGHGRGASGDHSRIIRRSYHTPGYVRLAGEAYRAWDEVEADSGERLVTRTGGLDLWPDGAAIPMDDYAGSLQACGVPFQELDAWEVMRRWPQWRLGDDVRGLFQEDGGVVAAARSTDVMRRLARESGATLRDRTPVRAIDVRGGEAAVLTDESAIRCRRVVVAADAWTNRLTEPLGTSLPLTVTQEQVTYFSPPGVDAFGAEQFPVWIWMDDPSFYGIPAHDGMGVKVAQDCGGEVVTADTRTFQPDQDNFARVLSFVEGHLPDAVGSADTRTCLYTLTPDRDFVVDALPEHPEVLVALGAAHAFKFSALLGRVLADLAVDGRTDPGLDLEPFRIDRPALTMEDAPVHWLV